MYITHKQDLVWFQFDMNRVLLQLYFVYLFLTNDPLFLSSTLEERKPQIKAMVELAYGETPFWSLEEASTCVLSLCYQ